MHLSILSTQLYLLSSVCAGGAVFSVPRGQEEPRACGQGLRWQHPRRRQRRGE